jgi:hypothetical protein
MRESGLEMKRLRIVKGRRDAVLPEEFSKRISSRSANDKEMVDMKCVSVFRWQ